MTEFTRWQGKTPLDFAKYTRLLQNVAALSRLFSTSEKPYVDYRFAEKLFIHCHSENVMLDITRKDNSFDAIYLSGDKKIGIGIKTFIGGATSDRHKYEKVAEFTRQAQTENLSSLDDEQLAIRVATLRNMRVRSDAKEYGIDVESSVYNCLIRTENAAFIHEEPYQLIDHNITVEKTRSNDNTTSVNFTDGIHHYKYNRSKNVLLRRFNEQDFLNSKKIPLVMFDDPFAWLESKMSTSPGGILIRDQFYTDKPTDNRPFVVLPLYSTANKKSLEKLVQEKSGINQWNGGGRGRTFGESYIPVPQAIHRLCRGFFPEPHQKNGKWRGTYFSLKLPNGVTDDRIHLCQENFKALMSNPNTNITKWLYELIDGSMDEAEKRKDLQQPYTYKDLSKIGKDSVAVLKNPDGTYSMEMLPLGAYESFIALAQGNAVPPYNDFLELFQEENIESY